MKPSPSYDWRSEALAMAAIAVGCLSIPLAAWWFLQ